MRLVEDAAATVGAAERSYAKRAPAANASAGDVELF